MHVAQSGIFALASALQNAEKSPPLSEGYFYFE
jgi:hypothetical protein